MSLQQGVRKHLPCSACLLRCSHSSVQNNYPETLGKTVIINAPTGVPRQVLAGARLVPALAAVQSCPLYSFLDLRIDKTAPSWLACTSGSVQDDLGRGAAHA